MSEQATEPNFEPGDVGDLELGVPGLAEPLPEVESDYPIEVNDFEEDEDEEAVDDGGS